MPRHIAGALKQHNKPFKSKHATKGELKANAKGRLAGVPITSASGGAQSRADRRNAARQRATAAREKLLMEQRAAQTGGRVAPRLTAVIPLTVESDAKGLGGMLAAGCNVLEGCAPPAGAAVHMTTAQRRPLSLAVAGCVQDALDLCKVADAVVLALHIAPNSGRADGVPLLTAEAEAVLSLLKAQGLPTTYVAVQGGAALQPATTQRVQLARAMLFSALQHHLPEVQRPVFVDTQEDANGLVRAIMAPLVAKQVTWRQTVPYLMADAVRADPAAGTVGVSGFLRSMPLSADRLVHITGVGTFQVDRIEEYLSPFRRHGRDTDNTPVGVFRPTENAETIQTENIPDPTLQEQTFPDEGDEAPLDTKPRGKVRLVPKGTSEYQACWLDDDDDDDDEEMDDDDDDDYDLGMPRPPPGQTVDQQQPAKEKEEEEDDEGMEGQEDDEEIDFEEEEDERLWKEERAKELEKKERKRLAEEDLEFPDEMDTPQTIPARVRFQKYRGLKSFRTTPWGPDLEPPESYGHVYALANYKAMARNSVAAAAEGDVMPGSYVTVWLRVPSGDTEECQSSPRVAQAVAAAQQWADGVAKDGARALAHPVLLSGLRRHENRTTVSHFTVRRYAQDVQTTLERDVANATVFAAGAPEQEVIKSRDLLTVDCGFRRFRARPAFSETTPVGAPNVSGKQKFLRFLPPAMGSGVCCASVYGPVCVSALPVLLWHRQPEQGCDTLVAYGSYECADTERRICKKVVLTAAPYKIQKKIVVARGMFFNREDVEWFKSVQLTTKLGRIGDIKEPVGTHGVMKCVFDGHLRQNDTICLNLYKRVYPKFPDEPSSK